MIYKRGLNSYECEESKSKQAISINNAIKWSRVGDWICYPLNDEGLKVGNKFITQPTEFYKTFKRVDGDIGD